MNDDDWAARLRALHEIDVAQAPPFGDVLARAEARPPLRLRRGWLAAAAAVGAVALVLPRPPDPPLPLPASASAATWRSPTADLLATPGGVAMLAAWRSPTASLAAIDDIDPKQP